jgi:O-antigen/teichoic acid export membrane protein
MTLTGKNLAVGAAEILGRLPLLLTTGILARSVGAEAYGSWAVILVFQALAAAVAGLGLGSSLSRLAAVADAPLARGYLGVAARACLLPLAVVAGVTLTLDGALTRLLGIDPGMRPLVAAAALLVAMTVAEGLLSSYFKARTQAGHYFAFVLVRTAGEIVAVVVVFRLAAPQAPATQLLRYLLLLCGIKAAGYSVLAAYRTGTASAVPDALRTEFLRYGLPMIPAVFLSWFTLQGDRLLLAHLADTASLGRYAFGASLAAYFVYVGYAVFPLMLPQSSRLHDAGDTEGLRRLFATYQQAMLAAYVAALGAVLPFARDAVVLLAGAAFESAAVPLAVLALAVCVDRVFGVYQYVFHLVKRPSWILWLSLVNAAMMAAAITSATLIGGVGAAPWALLLACVLFNAVRYAITSRYLQLPPPATVTVGVAAVIALGCLAPAGVWSWPLPARAGLAVSSCTVAFALANVAFDGRLVIAFRTVVAHRGFRGR